MSQDPPPTPPCWPPCPAHLLEVGPWGLRETRWADLELTASWRQFLDPTSFLRYLA